MEEGGAEVAVVGWVAGGEGFGGGVEFKQLPLGCGAGEPGEAREGGGGGGSGQDEGEAGDVAFCLCLAAVGEPEDAEGENAIDGGGRFGFVDGDDGAGGVGMGAGAKQEAAGVGGAEGFFEIHGGAEGVGVPVREVAREGALDSGEVTGADGFPGGGAAAGFGGRGEVKGLGAGCAEALGAQAQRRRAFGLGGYDRADDVAGVIPELKRAAIVGCAEGVFGGAEIEKDLAFFDD